MEHIIIIEEIDDWYYILIDNVLYYSESGIRDIVEVEDLTELTVWQYNYLVRELNIHCPKYSITQLEGRFV